MMIGRRPALLVAFSLLTSAATASAECAWVLWYGGKIHAVNWHFSPKGTYQPRHECYRAMRNDPALAELKDKDLEFVDDGTLDQDQPYEHQFHWFGHGVVLIDTPKSDARFHPTWPRSLRLEARLWWSCQPETKQHKGNSLRHFPPLWD